MKKTMWVSGIAALALVLGSGTFARSQSATDPSNTQRPSTKDSKDGKDLVTLTGCLQSGEASATGTTGSSAGSSARSGDHFILANARTGGSSTTGSSTSTGTSTTTGTAGSLSSSMSSSSGSSYILEGDSSELKKHVGHEIEVTGHLDNSGAPSSSTGSSTSAASSSYGSKSSGSMQKVHVNAVRMISASCSAK